MENGKLLGRKFKVVNQNKYEEYRALKLSDAGIARLMGISPKTLYRRIKGWKVQEKA
jgi:hypothetical protein